MAGDVALASWAIHFEPTYLGASRTQPLLLRNGSRTDRVVSLSTPAPFSAPASVTVPGGGQLEVPLGFEPSVEGVSLGTLSLVDGAQAREVALDGVGLQPPSCVPALSCRVARFDGATGACLETVAPDGSDCSGSNACLTGASCLNGVCLGSARDCADQNPCTDDACEPSGGCVHLPTHCAAPADPCKVAHCDARLGCVQADAQDGTSCGAADCTAARVCIAGTCKTVPVPDGASCGAATPCQGVGSCQQHLCQQAGPQPLSEAWSYDFPDAFSGFRGVTDASQNLYWVECRSSGVVSTVGCAVTSFDRDGTLRFRQPIPESPAPGNDVPHLLAADHLVFALADVVGSVSSHTGSPQWTLSLGAALQGAPDVASSFVVRWMVSDGAGQVYLALARTQGLPDAVGKRKDALLKVDSVTGLVVLRRFFDAQLTTGVLDEHDNLYLGATASGSSQSELLSFDSSGVERWRVAVAGQPDPIAAYNGEVTLRTGAVRSSSDGGLRASTPVGWLLRNTLMSSARRTVLHEQSSSCCPDSAFECECPASLPSLSVGAFAPGSSLASWDVQLALSSGQGAWNLASDLVAASQGDALVAVQSNPSFTRLTALTAAGAVRFSCEIPASPPASPYDRSTFDTSVALLDGRWAVIENLQCASCKRPPNPRLRVFEVPGVTPATSGWTGAGGSPSGAGRPLP